MLIWEQAKYAGEIGYISAGEKRIRIASIGWSTIRDDATPWRLRVEIPGFTRERKFATTDAARAETERLLALFVSLATAALEGAS
jgi:hypothetical protein